MTVPSAEIDYTHLPDVIRLFIQTDSHPLNVEAFCLKQAGRQADYEAQRRVWREANGIASAGGRGRNP